MTIDHSDDDDDNDDFDEDSLGEGGGGWGSKMPPPPFTDGFRKKFLIPLRYEASLREALITITTPYILYKRPLIPPP